MKQVYPEAGAFAKRPSREFAAELDALCREKISQVVQAYLEAEVDELLQRVRYERSSGEVVGYRDGRDPRREITTGAGPITIARPRVRGVKHESKLVPPYRRRLPSVDKTMHQLDRGTRASRFRAGVARLARGIGAALTLHDLTGECGVSI